MLPRSLYLLPRSQFDQMTKMRGQLTLLNYKEWLESCLIHTFSLQKYDLDKHVQKVAFSLVTM
jgi:hypothetical protein